MIHWYHVFIACTLLLWIGSSPRDRNALRILLIASLASEVIVDGITHQIEGAWKLVIPGAVEVLTIVAMLRYSRNRTGYLQIACLVVAWLSHLLCYLDIILKTDLVYSRYEIILQWVAAGQLVSCYDTLLFNLGNLYTATASAFRADGLCVIPSASLRPDVSSLSGDKNLCAIKRK